MLSPNGWVTVLDFEGTLRFLPSQILCRFYKSPLKETVNWGPPCVYVCKKITHTLIKDPVVHVWVRWIMETPKHYALKVARIFRKLKLDTIRKWGVGGGWWWWGVGWGGQSKQQQKTTNNYILTLILRFPRLQVLFWQDWHGSTT